MTERPEGAGVQVDLRYRDTAVRELMDDPHCDGLRLAVTRVDPDPRALAFVADLPPADGVTYTAALVTAGERFDLVTSNHLLHSDLRRSRTVQPQRPFRLRATWSPRG